MYIQWRVTLGELVLYTVGKARLGLAGMIMATRENYDGLTVLQNGRTLSDLLDSRIDTAACGQQQGNRDKNRDCSKTNTVALRMHARCLIHWRLPVGQATPECVVVA